ncbi:MAG: hypothetical protein JWR21_2386 [Herminiimonas sp.]|nr:hypothetical protein [Herminiimonas sp.]
MALTMTRTRTQTALTKLAELVANLNGELEVVVRLTRESPQHQDALNRRRLRLEGDRDALYLTLKQFDPELDPTAIGVSDLWFREYGRRGSKPAVLRYLKKVGHEGLHPRE